MLGYTAAFRLFLVVSIVALIGMAAWYFIQRGPAARLEPLAAALASGEDMVIAGARLLEKTGNKTTLRINAEKAVISTSRKKIALSGFSVTSFGGGEGPMTIIGEEGVMDNASKDVSAQGGVFVMDGQGRAMFTEKVEWTESGKILESQSPVWIFGPNFLIKGDRLTVETELGRAAITGGVTAIFNRD